MEPIVSDWSYQFFWIFLASEVVSFSYKKASEDFVCSITLQDEFAWEPTTVMRFGLEGQVIDPRDVLIGMSSYMGLLGGM